MTALRTELGLDRTLWAVVDRFVNNPTSTQAETETCVVCATPIHVVMYDDVTPKCAKHRRQQTNAEAKAQSETSS